MLLKPIVASRVESEGATYDLGELVMNDSSAILVFFTSAASLWKCCSNGKQMIFCDLVCRAQEAGQLRTVRLRGTRNDVSLPDLAL